MTFASERIYKLDITEANVESNLFFECDEDTVGAVKKKEKKRGRMADDDDGLIHKDTPPPSPSRSLTPPPSKKKASVRRTELDLLLSL